MPTTSQSSVGNATGVYTYTYPNIAPRTENRSLAYTVGSQIRSSLVKTKFDASGWRNPLPYQGEFFYRSGWNGQFVCEAPYIDSRWKSLLSINGSLTAWSASTSGLPSYQESMPGSNLDNAAIVKALLKVKDQKVHLGNLIAESGKTAKSISDSFKTLALAYSSVKRGDVKRAAKYLGVKAPSKDKGKDASSRWLGLQYGWLPLLSDIHGVYEEITRSTMTRPARFSVSATVTDPLSRTPTIDFSVPSFLETYGAKVGECRQNGVRGVKIALTYELDNPALFKASQVGLVNPLEIAWELTPWSFVLDWAIPVGDWLSALTADAGLTFKGGTKTRFVKCDKQFQLIGGSRVGTSYSCRGTGQCVTTYMKFTRETYTASPIPVPYYKNPLSVRHGLNGLALLRQVL